MRAFSDYNPAAVFVSLMSCAGVVMFTANPVMAVISLVGAIALWFVREGTDNMRSHLLCAVILLLSPVFNMLFSHNGRTVLLVINNNPVTLEACLYGLGAAVMLIAVLYWFRSFSRIMTSDKLLYLLGSVSPKLSLMFTMALRFVPHFGRQAQKTDNAQRAVGLYNEDSFIDLVRGKLKVFSVMMTWALENGITTADSMTARGYGTGRRTAFSLFRFRREDVIFIAVNAVLLAVCIAGMAAGAVDYSYYPSTGDIPRSAAAVAVYLSYGGLALLPAIIELEVKLRWRSLRSSI